VRRSLLLLLTAVLVQTLGAVVAHSLGILAPFLISEFALTEAEFGILPSAMHVGSLAALTIGASLIDRIGPLRLLGVGALVSGVVLLAGVVAGDYAVLLVVLAIVGAAWGLAAIAGGEVIILDAPIRRRATITSLRQLALPVGGLLAAAMAPLVAVIGWQGMLVVEALLLAAVGAAIMAYPAMHAHRSRRSPWLQLPTRRGAAIGVLSIGLTITQTAFLVYAVLELTRRVGLGFEAAAALYLASQTVGAISRVAIGALSDASGWSRTGLLAVTTLLAGASAAAFGALGPTTPIWVTLAVVLGGSIFLIGWNGLLVVALLEAGPAADVNRNLSAGMTLMRIGIILSPPTFGLLLVAVGSMTAWLVLAGLMVGIAVGFLVLGASPHERPLAGASVPPDGA